MGTKRVGLARTQALIQGLARSLTLTGTTIKGATWSNGVFNSDQQFTCSGNAVFTSSTPLHTHQATPTVLADSAAIVAKGAYKTRIATCTPTGALAKTTDTAANIINECAMDNDGDSFDFTIINLATTASYIITLTGGDSVAIVGDERAYPEVDGEDTSGSATWRVRRTGESALSMYRIA